MSVVPLDISSVVYLRESLTLETGSEDCFSNLGFVAQRDDTGRSQFDQPAMPSLKGIH